MAISHVNAFHWTSIFAINLLTDRIVRDPQPHEIGMSGDLYMLVVALYGDIARAAVNIKLSIIEEHRQ